MPRLDAQEPKPGAVYNDKKEPSILWYVGRSYPKQGCMIPLRRKTPQPTEPWVFTPADYAMTMSQLYPNGI
jgi:hypothetical protein